MVPARYRGCDWIFHGIPCSSRCSTLSAGGDRDWEFILAKQLISFRLSLLENFHGRPSNPRSTLSSRAKLVEPGSRPNCHLRSRNMERQGNGSGDGSPCLASSRNCPPVDL